MKMRIAEKNEISHLELGSELANEGMRGKVPTLKRGREDKQEKIKKAEKKGKKGFGYSNDPFFISRFNWGFEFTV